MSDDCDDALSELYLFLDRELDEQTRSVIEGHLRACSPCLEAFDFELELRRVVADRCRDRVPDALRRQVFDALRAEAGES